MFLPPLHLPLISAGCFGAVLGRMLDFVSLRIRRSDQGMTPSLSPGLRAQTVALHRRLVVLAGEFHRLAKLAREGLLRVYPDRASLAGCPAGRLEKTGLRSRAVPRARPEPASPFGQPDGVAQGPTLPALPTRGFGWMLGFVPAAHRDPLAGLLGNPEMVALIQASPSVARLLRSLCHGLGVARPEGVFPAPARRGEHAPGPRSQGGARADSARVDYTGGTGPGSASRQRVATVMSAQARDRWWADHRRTGCFAGEAAGAAGRFDAPARGRCAKS